MYVCVCVYMYKYMDVVVGFVWSELQQGIPLLRAINETSGDQWCYVASHLSSISQTIT